MHAPRWKPRARGRPSAWTPGFAHRGDACDAGPVRGVGSRARRRKRTPRVPAPCVRHARRGHASLPASPAAAPGARPRAHRERSPHDQVLFQPRPESDESRAVPRGGRAALRSPPRRHPPWRAARGRVPRDQPQRQGARHRRRRCGRVRQQRDPALSRGEDRIVPAARHAGRPRRAAVVAHVHRVGRGSVLGPVRALSALRARAVAVRAEPLPVRGEAALRHPGRAARDARIHGRRCVRHRRHGAVGMGEDRPLCDRRRRMGHVAQPQAPPGRDQCASGGRPRQRTAGEIQVQDRDGRRVAARDVPAHGACPQPDRGATSRVPGS